ncbi:SCO family protein [Vibrio vulnificus]|uniref:SCO family protein n=1 Tax=Vibrio vulnificus TaxID=672 RepID=UPI001023B7F5|nr:SCO family protein [Vibrio vulnificus]EGR0753419.1 SCO family protein [Vibrio vulnificus]ELM0339449.1 SCO family protein [Vibrio vulnificus]RZP94893.1 SCO family protein [Vibrio vulnificus]RZQ20049.1 SCO family protein [Vibrio vulnificus]RZQ25255.1 SCO family protein [Vibrio vulnificus]
MKILSKYLTCLVLTCLSLKAAAKPLQFELQEHNLGKVTQNNWQGKHLLIGIGYTSCPDICPTTAIDLAIAVNGLGDKNTQVIPIFISVDPNRDTVENMDLYVKYFDPKLVGLTGSQEQIKQVAKSLKATYGYSLEGKPIYPPLPKQYEVFHSAYIYFYGPDRELIDVFGYGEGGSKISASLKGYLNE